MANSSSTRALIRFHWAAGARVALRANAMVGAIVVVLFGSAPVALTALRNTVLEFVSPGVDWRGRMIYAAICVALAGVGMPRVTLGATGWLRGLPASSAANRRAAVAALCWTQAFAILVGALTPVFAVVAYHARLSPGKLAGIPIAIVAAAMAVLPVRGLLGPAFAFLALGMTVPGHWWTNAAAIVCLVASDSAAGAIVPLKKRRAKSPKTLPAKPLAPARWQWARLTWRSLPKANVLAGFFFPIIFAAFGYFIVVNNPDLPPDIALRTVRISGSLALLALGAGLANTIMRGRPVWAWARSLPWTARNRVLNDAALLLCALILVPIALAPLAFGPAFAVAATTPTIAASGAAAIRAGAGRQTGAAGEVVIVAIIAGVLIGLWPLACVPVLLASPAFIRLAENRDRRTRATRWDDLHHDAAGDPAWLGA